MIPRQQLGAMSFTYFYWQDGIEYKQNKKNIVSVKQKVFEVGDNNNQYCLQILKGVSRRSKLKDIAVKFTERNPISWNCANDADNYIFYKGAIIFMVYLKNWIFICSSRQMLISISKAYKAYLKSHTVELNMVYKITGPGMHTRNNWSQYDVPFMQHSFNQFCSTHPGC